MPEVSYADITLPPPVSCSTTSYLPESYLVAMRRSIPSTYHGQMFQQKKEKINFLKSWWHRMNLLPDISKSLPPYVSEDFVKLLVAQRRNIDEEYYDGVVTYKLWGFFMMMGSVVFLTLILLVDIHAAALLSASVTVALFHLLQASPNVLGLTLVSFIQTQTLLIILLSINTEFVHSLNTQWSKISMDQQQDILAGPAVMAYSLEVLIPLVFIFNCVVLLILIVGRGRSKQRQVISELRMNMRDCSKYHKNIWIAESGSGSISTGTTVISYEASTETRSMHPPPAYNSIDEIV